MINLGKLIIVAVESSILPPLFSSKRVGSDYLLRNQLYMNYDCQNIFSLSQGLHMAKVPIVNGNVINELLL